MTASVAKNILASHKDQTIYAVYAVIFRENSFS